jgi:hypothetical protein
MENQSITVTKILAVYEEIQRAWRLSEIVMSEDLKHQYRAEASAMWTALDIMLGNNNVGATIDQVIKLKNLRAIKAA